MKRRALFVIVVLALSLTQAGCLGETASKSKSANSEKPAKPKKNTNPQRGWVKAFTHFGESYSYDDIVVYKRCNGRNLVYLSGRSASDYGSQSISVIPEDKQCIKPQ